MFRLARVALAIVGITVTVASSSLPSVMPATATATAQSTSNSAPYDSASTVSDVSVAAVPAAQAASTTSAEQGSASDHVFVQVVSATASSADDVNAVSEQDARDLVASMSDYWSGESGGQVTIDFGGFETASLGLESCDPDSVLSAAPATAFDGRFANEAWRGTADHLLILTTESCANAGQATVGGNGGLIISGNGTNSALSRPVAFHEFGHNLGFGHAGSSICRSNVTTDAAAGDFAASTSLCPTDEYGDPLDIMGYSVAGAMPHLSTAQRIRSGWLTDYTTVTGATGPITTTVTSLDGASGNRALRIVDPKSGAVYYVEYRTASGADATSTEFTGGAKCAVISGFIKCSGGVSAAEGSVRILRELPYAGHGDLVRTTVVAVGSTGVSTTRNTRFTVGDTFASTGGGFYVTLNSASPSAGASLSVRFTAPESTATAVVLPAAKQAFGAAGVVQAKVTSAGGATTGTVTFFDGDTMIGQGQTVGGTASIAVGASFAIGTHSISARYTPAVGSNTTASEASAKKLVVVKAKTVVKIKLSKAAHSTGKRLAKVSVTIPGAKTSGVLRVYADGKKLRTVKLSKTTISVTIPKGTKRVVAKYAGTKTAAAASVSKKLVVKKLAAKK